MDRIRVLSDLHVDINERYPLELADKDVFTVVCGDTGGETDMAVDWIKKNVRRGVVVHGNHLPYCNTPERGPAGYRTMDELRARLSEEFPPDGDVSYLDVQAGFFKKVVDGVMFLGGCMYTDFAAKHPVWNPDGDAELNMENARWHMRDYRYGYVSRSFPAGADNEPAYERLRPTDCLRWFGESAAAFEKALAENEASASPLPVVVATHYPLVSDLLGHNAYVEDPEWIDRRGDFIWGSYASDRLGWLLSHPSVRCACSGHVHDAERAYRLRSVPRPDGPPLLLVHNPRGYVQRGHARWFNPDTFVRLPEWRAEERELTPEEDAEREKPGKDYLEALLSMGFF